MVFFDWRLKKKLEIALYLKLRWRICSQALLYSLKMMSIIKAKYIAKGFNSKLKLISKRQRLNSKIKKALRISSNQSSLQFK